MSRTASTVDGFAMARRVVHGRELATLVTRRTIEIVMLEPVTPGVVFERRELRCRHHARPAPRKSLSCAWRADGGRVCPTYGVEKKDR